MCAEPDAIYRQQLVEMRALLPQHLGLRKELWLLPTGPDPALRAYLWTLPPPRTDSSFAERAEWAERAEALRERTVLRASRLIQQAWRGRACGPLGCGPYRRTVNALREMSACSTPLHKAERVLRALNFLTLECGKVLQAEASSDEIAADELLPLFVFVLIRAQVCMQALTTAPSPSPPPSPSPFPPTTSCSSEHRCFSPTRAPCMHTLTTAPGPSPPLPTGAPALLAGTFHRGLPAQAACPRPARLLPRHVAGGPPVLDGDVVGGGAPGGLTRANASTRGTPEITPRAGALIAIDGH